jgi:hypothetical protein
MGEEGVPQGVVTLREATGVKPGRDWRPVPPITAMGMGPGSVVRKVLYECDRAGRYALYSTIEGHLLRTVVRVSNVGHLAEADVYVSLERGGVAGI